jgi:hypothetical protein
MAGVPPALADELYGVYTEHGTSEAAQLAFQRLAAQCYYDLKRLNGILN